MVTMMVRIKDRHQLRPVLEVFVALAQLLLDLQLQQYFV